MPAPWTTLVILGASGDLTTRLLLPGLGTLLAHAPDRRVELIGVSREELTARQWSDRVAAALRDGGCPNELVEEIREHTAYHRLDVTSSQGVTDLLDGIEDLDRTVLYFALPPPVTSSVCELLADREVGGLRLALEKPFGHDLDEARRLNRLLARFRSEEQVFRVDHFLGDSQVLNILGLRFANRLFEPLWNGAHIESVDIVADETLALEGRAGYYDGAGALVDMHQSHLLLILALVAMEEPARIESLELHDMMVHALRATRVIDDSPESGSRRARYTAGQVGDRTVPSYADEEGVDASRQTETLAELDVELTNRRWAGVRFRLRSGKALERDVRHVVVRFRPVDYVPSGLDQPPPNTLTIDLEPDRLCLRLATMGIESRLALDATELTADLRPAALTPYGQVLAGILDGDPLLSVRGDVAEECWRICMPVLHAWSQGRVPLEEYAAGSTGPAEWE